MSFIPSLRRKAFIVQRVGEDMPSKMTVESVPNPRHAQAEEVRMIAAAQGVELEMYEPPEILKFTTPDGAEYLVADETLEDILAAVRDSRAFFAAKT